MRVRRSTWIWLAVLAAAAIPAAALGPTGEDGCLHGLLVGVALLAFLVLAARGSMAAFRAITRRLTLRLAFSYFLIGIVPIPLLAALLSLAGYLVAHQYVANRLRREITAVGEAAVRSRAPLPAIEVADDGRIVASDLAWLRPGTPAPWLRDLPRPGFLIQGEQAWLAVPAGAPGRIRLLRLTDAEAPWLQRLADRTGYEVGVEIGSTRRSGSGIDIDLEERGTAGIGSGASRRTAGAVPMRRPTAAPPPGKGLWRRQWVYAFYLETALNGVSRGPDAPGRVVVLMARTSPETIFHQLFAQGIAEIGHAFWVAFAGLAGALLLVYLVALAVAFGLVGSIARNVNRLTRASRAVARGDFSVRIDSKSRDQIGDLARSFDDMAASIERLLVETARKQRLESELAIARTVQQKILPPPEARRTGLSVHALFEPVAELGGDYYDYLPMSGGRTGAALGDVSGHGLATGLLVAMAKAALSTLLDAGHEGGDLFARLNDLIHRSTDPRHYMTLVLLAYDPSTRRGVLTNAGQLAPYRISGRSVETLSLPALPLGLFPERSFPSAEFSFAPGDILVFLSDGLVEATNPAGEEFGFERFEGVLREHAAEGAAALRDALMAAVRTHTAAAPAQDDCTLLLLTLD